MTFDDSGLPAGSLSGPCDVWPLPDEWCCTIPATPAVTGAAAAAATEILWAASGRRFGTCTATVYPCPEECAPSWAPLSAAWGWPYPRLVDGSWVNAGCGDCGDDCACTSAATVVFHQFPVLSVGEVVVDGEVLATGSYQLWDHRRLVRSDGGRWPLCQDWAAGGSWSARLTVGEPVPATGVLAMGELTCELTKGCAGGDCRLPRRVVDMTRAGVSVSFADVQQLVEGRLFGLEAVDYFVGAFNPHGLPDRPRIYSPDVAPQRQRT
jgi:hypothetical protein